MSISPIIGSPWRSVQEKHDGGPAMQIESRSQHLQQSLSARGEYQGAKTPKQVNTGAKAAMMVALDRHRKYVPESQRYYEKKRSGGKKHNQAIRSLGRHSLGSSTECSRKTAPPRDAPKRGIPRLGSVPKHSLKRKYGSRKFHRSSKNHKSLRRRALTPLLLRLKFPAG